MKYPYYEWEDYLNGMYLIPSKPYNQNLINQCVKLLSNEIVFFETAMKMIKVWKKCSSHNLEDRSINRKAWIGQASCCYKFNCPELVVREAWSLITNINKYKANKIAEKIIQIYEAENRKIHSRMEKERLLF